MSASGLTTAVDLKAAEALAFRLATIEAYPFTSSKETMQRGAQMIRDLCSALTASGEALRTVRDGLICTRQAPHQYDANHYCANCGSDHARLKDVIDAAMEKANG